jgi:hypothetical protein
MAPEPQPPFAEQHANAHEQPGKEKHDNRGNKLLHNNLLFVNFARRILGPGDYSS